MMAIRLQHELETRLDELSRRTGQTKTYHANRAIAGYLARLDRELEQEMREEAAE